MFVVKSAGHRSSGHEFVIVMDRLSGMCGSEMGGGIKSLLGGEAVELADALVAAVVAI